MPYTYQADVWCDPCGERIIAELTEAGKAPANPSDESSFDSDNFPKRYDADAEQADSPQNCASGNCGGGYAVGGGVFLLSYGRFLQNGLTAEGYRSLKAMLNGQGETLTAPAKEWAEFYQFTYFSNPYSSAHEWLTQTIQNHGAEICDRYDTQRCTHAAALVSLAGEMASKLDGDDIQDLFQADMDADDYFKLTGWYSPEMD